MAFEPGRVLLVGVEGVEVVEDDVKFLPRIRLKAGEMNLAIGVAF
jgi:hypothetical protein